MLLETAVFSTDLELFIFDSRGGEDDLDELISNFLIELNDRTGELYRNLFILS